MSTNNSTINENDEHDDIPLADDETTEEVTDSDLLKLNLANITGLDKLESIQQQQNQNQQQPNSLEVNLDLNPDEMEERERMIQQVLELQNTLDDLSLRVESVKEENLKLKSENQVLGQYIENLVSASSVFQSTSPKTRNNKTSNISMKT